MNRNPEAPRKAGQKRTAEEVHEEQKEPKTRRQLIHDLMAKLEKDFQPGKTKVTVADFIRLAQLERELEEEEQPREIIITWSDPSLTQNAEK